jgi:SH3-like domain-containing protein
LRFERLARTRGWIGRGLAAARGAGLRIVTHALPMLLLASCSRFQKLTHDYVYVSARQQYLHDRVAAVSNRVGLVTNGEKLEVIEHGKRFLKVKTPKGEVGWLEEHAVIDDKLYAQFEDQQKKHAQDPVVANGQLRDDRYLHLQPGRETPHFLLIAANTKVQLLARGSVAKAPLPGQAPASKPALSPGAGKNGPQAATKPGSALSAKTAPAPAASPVPAAPVAMEDWWLVRDAAGDTGWLLSGQLDVDVPDDVAQYSEGQRMVAAYPIAKVTDDGSGRINSRESRKSGKGGKGATAKASESLTEPATTGASREITEYVTVLSPPRNGLPYDFDQVRVFTWSLNHHRYETGYRLRGIQGYLPVKIGQETVNGMTYPTFTFDIATGQDVKIDPDTGITRPVSTRTISFRLEGNIIRRTGADQGPIVPNHDPSDPAKKASAKKKRR